MTELYTREPFGLGKARDCRTVAEKLEDVIDEFVDSIYDKYPEVVTDIPLLETVRVVVEATDITDNQINTLEFNFLQIDDDSVIKWLARKYRDIKIVGVGHQLKDRYDAYITDSSGNNVKLLGINVTEEEGTKLGEGLMNQYPSLDIGWDLYPHYVRLEGFEYNSKETSPYGRINGFSLLDY